MNNIKIKFMNQFYHQIIFLLILSIFEIPINYKYKLFYTLKFKLFMVHLKNIFIFGIICIIHIDIVINSTEKYKRNNQKDKSHPYSTKFKFRNSQKSIKPIIPTGIHIHSNTTENKSNSNTEYLISPSTSKQSLSDSIDECISSTISNNMSNNTNNSVDEFMINIVNDTRCVCNSTNDTNSYNNTDEVVINIVSDSKELSKNVDITTPSNIRYNKTFGYYMSMNRYINRNYTKQVYNIKKLVLVHTSMSLHNYNLIIKKGNDIIKEWRDNSTVDIWTLIKNIKLNVYSKNRLIMHMVDLDSDELRNPVYYNGFLTDLFKYMQVHGPSVYINTISNIKQKKETLGDIWINKEVNIYCCYCGISKQIVIEVSESDIEKDIKLKKNMNIILYIPEVYEDFCKIPLRLISRVFKELKEKSYNNSNNITMENIFIYNHIIMYLIGVVQENSDIIEESYNIIKEIEKDINNSKISIYDFNCIEVYTIVYNAVKFFYEEFPYVYMLSHEENNLLRSKKFNKYIYVHPSSRYNKIMGGHTVTLQKYIRHCAIINETIKSESAHDKCKIIIINDKMYTNMTSTEISIKEHYHVQFVDNVRHTLEIIHLPYYLHKTANSKYVLHQIHKIKDIITHLKCVYDIGTSKYKKNQGYLYAFKYNIKSKAWSLVRGTKNLNKTVEEMESTGHNIIFYYVNENIHETKFYLAEFTYPLSIKDEINDDNIHKPRIPLLLSVFMSSAIIIGPYDINYNNNEVPMIESYTNMYPIVYMHNYKEIMDKTLLPKERSENISHAELLQNISINERKLNCFIKYYYSDFFIRNSNDWYEDHHCYCMNINQEVNGSTNNSIIKWNTRVYDSVYEYTTYRFNTNIKDTRAFIRNNQSVHTSFIDMLNRKNPSMNMAMYGYCIYKSINSKEYMSCPMLCHIMKDLLGTLNTYLLDTVYSEDIKNRGSNGIENKDNEGIFNQSILDQLIVHYSFIPNDVLNFIHLDNYEDIKNALDGVISIRNNNYNGCKYGIHYDILSWYISKV
ncbi:hypothetical protein NEIRO03_0532 [Nematocida sp. AWRm78]|nr:hypothetical protein NEIRO02_1184 [Nematocida sp. AWRm79]KAI5182892.1 hypothetical protein NEIRO03_0532 [Nematocida sp. AWRm78]